MSKSLDYLYGILNVFYRGLVLSCVSLQGWLASLDEKQFTIGLVVLISITVVMCVLFLIQQKRIVRLASDLRLLGHEFSKVTEELNVERVWRIAGKENNEVPEETLKKIYQAASVDRLAG